MLMLGGGRFVRIRVGNVGVVVDESVGGLVVGAVLIVVAVVG
jgi:hypothetical protein